MRYDTVVIYLFYGNSSVSTSQQNGTGVWDSHYEVIQHFPAGRQRLPLTIPRPDGINGTPQTDLTGGDFWARWR